MPKTPIEGQPQLLNDFDAELEAFIKRWQLQGSDISSFFIDENGDPVEVSRFQPNILPEYIIELAKARKLLPQETQ